MAVNYLAILVSGIISMALGVIWYGPLFGKIWMQLSNISKEQIEKAKNKGDVNRAYLINFILALVMAYVVAILVQAMNIGSFIGGMNIGFLAWLGFIVPTMSGSVLWEGKPVQLYALNVGYHLVSLIIIGGILAVWV